MFKEFCVELLLLEVLVLFAAAAFASCACCSITYGQLLNQWKSEPLAPHAPQCLSKVDTVALGALI